jgi:hypothetical protein
MTATLGLLFLEHNQEKFANNFYNMIVHHNRFQATTCFLNELKNRQLFCVHKELTLQALIISGSILYKQIAIEIFDSGI